MSASTLVSRNTSIGLFQVLAKDVLVAGLGDFFIGPLALGVAAPEVEEFVYGVGALLGIGSGRDGAALHVVGDEAGADDAGVDGHFVSIVKFGVGWQFNGTRAHVRSVAWQGMKVNVG